MQFFPCPYDYKLKFRSDKSLIVLCNRKLILFQNQLNSKTGECVDSMMNVRLHLDKLCLYL
jgi:hypothetical protein